MAVIWWSAAGIVAVVLGAGLAALRRGGWAWLGAGAAGWLGAQVLKGVLLLPLLAARGATGPATVAALATTWWFVPGAALLAAGSEELGKYLPLRWLRVQTWDHALALGLGAGAMEALLLAAGLLAAASAHGPAEPAVMAALAVWERFWAVALHAGLATVVGIAVVRRQARWFGAAVALHFIGDLGAGWYQHLVALHTPAPSVLPVLYGTEVWTALVAVAAWMWGLRLWRAQASPNA